MSIFRAPVAAYAGPKLIDYLFVDGGCLRATLGEISKRYLGPGQVIALDHAHLRGSHQKVFYYDAVPVQERGQRLDEWHAEIEPRLAELAQIQALDGFHVGTGDIRGRKPGKQKRVDVMIAVDMLMHTVRANMQQCTLLAGDVDFQPLLEQLVREGMFVTLWHPAQAAQDLIGAADSLRPLGVVQLGPALRRAGGLPLLPEFQNGVRPPMQTVPVATWVDEASKRGFELYRQGKHWTLERFDLLAAATSERATDEDPRILFSAAEDVWGVEVHPGAWALLDRV